MAVSVYGVPEKLKTSSPLSGAHEHPGSQQYVSVPVALQLKTALPKFCSR